MNLTEQDFEVLIEAVGAWENKPSDGRLTSTLIGMVMARSKEESDEAVDQLKTKIPDEVVRKERGTLLKAKLIQLRDSRVAETAVGASCAE